MTNEFPCKCGHSWEMHQEGLSLMNGNFFPTGCDADLHKGEFCYKFVPDNLKYIEKRYEQKLSL